MEFKEFAEVICNKAKETLAEDYTVDVRDVQKNNGLVLTGLSIMEKDSHVAPTIYLNDFYEQYKNGGVIEEIFNRIMNVYFNNKAPEFGFDIDDFKDFEKIKDKIFFKLISKDANEEKLAEMPYKQMLDLAMVYVVNVGNVGETSATVTIRNDHLKMWEKTVEDIDKIAQENTPKMFPANVKPLSAILAEMMGEEFEDECPMDVPLWFISNESKYCGAAVIAYAGELQKLSEKIGSDLYVIPSSIHECLCIPTDGDMTPDMVKGVIGEVNDTQVAAEEVLSYSLYKYSKEEGLSKVA